MKTFRQNYWQSIGLIIERLIRPNIFFESVSSDLYYCYIGNFNKRSGLKSVVWNEGSNWRFRLTNEQMKFEKYFVNDNTCYYYTIDVNVPESRILNQDKKIQMINSSDKTIGRVLD